MIRFFQQGPSKLKERSKEFEQLRIDQEKKAREELQGSGLDQLICFTLDNFAFRYLETSHSKNIQTEFLGEGIYSVHSFELEPMSALKIQDQKAKKGIVTLAKRFSSTKGVGLKVKLELLCDTSKVVNGSGTIQCHAVINWNMDNDFEDDIDFTSKKSVSYDFSDILDLRNKLALLLEDVCTIF